MNHSKAFLETLQKWVTTQPNILAVCLVGSHARGAAGPDSDIDVVIITEEPDMYLQNASWLAHFGEVQSVEKENWGLLQSLRTFYANELEVEFGITTSQWPKDEGSKEVMNDGIKIVFDPQNLLKDVILQRNNQSAGEASS